MISFLMSPIGRYIAGFGIALALLFGAYEYAYHKGYASCEDKYRIELAKQQQLADEKSAQMKQQSDALEERLSNENQRINVDLDRALKRLRQRPARLPQAALSTCKGTTGAELSAKDSEFLSREAARADRLRAALEACYGWEDTVIKK